MKRLRIADENEAAALAPGVRSMVREWCALGDAAQARTTAKRAPGANDVKSISGRSAPTTIDEYLSAVSSAFRRLLGDLRQTIRSAAPSSTESISYGIPTFKQDGERLIYFSAATKHCAIHMVRKVHLDEAVQLGFGVGRGSIRFTPEKPLPKRLVTRIVKTRLTEIASTAKERRSARSG